MLPPLYSGVVILSSLDKQAHWEQGWYLCGSGSTLHVQSQGHRMKDLVGFMNLCLAYFIVMSRLSVELLHPFMCSLDRHPSVSSVPWSKMLLRCCSTDCSSPKANCAPTVNAKVRRALLRNTGTPAAKASGLVLKINEQFPISSNKGANR